MPSHLVALCIAANDPDRLARFWAGVLGRGVLDDGPALIAKDAAGFDIRFPATGERKVGPNRMHLHLTSTSLEDQQSTVTRVLELGGQHLDVGQDPADEHVVLADPEGNEFCVIEPDNRFLAGCGFLGEVTCEGSQAVGYFWSEALGWPLVWDRDQETAIQSPGGGTKISWGGPPVAPKIGKGRLHFVLASPAGQDVRSEAERLASLGATRSDLGPASVGWVSMADPDGNDFRLLGSL